MASGEETGPGGEGRGERCEREEGKNGSFEYQRISIDYLQFKSMKVEMEISCVKLVLEALQINSFIRLDLFKLDNRISI